MSKEKVFSDWHEMQFGGYLHQTVATMPSIRAEIDAAALACISPEKAIIWLQLFDTVDPKADANETIGQAGHNLELLLGFGWKVRTKAGYDSVFDMYWATHEKIAHKEDPGHTCGGFQAARKSFAKAVASDFIHHFITADGSSHHGMPTSLQELTRGVMYADDLIKLSEQMAEKMLDGSFWTDRCFEMEMDFSNKTATLRHPSDKPVEETAVPADEWSEYIH